MDRTFGLCTLPSIFSLKGLKVLLNKEKRQGRVVGHHWWRSITLEVSLDGVKLLELAQFSLDDPYLKAI